VVGNPWAVTRSLLRSPRARRSLLRLRTCGHERVRNSASPYARYAARVSRYFHSAPPHSDPQLRTSKTLLDSWVWLDATEEGLGDWGASRVRRHERHPSGSR